MSKLQRSWTLFRCAMTVIFENRKLLLFPVLVFVLTCSIVLFFLAPLSLWDTGHSFTEAAHWKSLADHWATWGDSSKDIRLKPEAYAALAATYLASVFLATFFNVAFFHEILRALNGQRVSIRGGFRFAVSRVGAILAWSLFAGAVGLIIKALERRVELVGQWILRFVGIAWSVASVFVIPIIVREEKRANPVFFLKSSAGVLRKTWGESLIGYAGIQFGGFILLVGALGFIGLGVALAILTGHLWIFIGAIVLCILIIAFLAYVLGTASQVYRAALYIYATEGVVPGPFDQEQMDMAWTVKHGRAKMGI